MRHRAGSIEVLSSLVANGEGTGISYTNPAGLISYDGKPVRRVQINDSAALEPVVLVYAGMQPSPLPQIRSAIAGLANLPVS